MKDNTNVRALTVREQVIQRRGEIRLWIADLPEKGLELDNVTLAYVTKMAINLGLSNDDLNEMIRIKDRFQTTLPQLNKLMRDENLSLEEAEGLFEAREIISHESCVDMTKQQYGISLKKILTFSRRFPSAALDNESLGSVILEAHENIRRKLHWVVYLSTAIDLLCGVAEEYELADVDTAVNALTNNREDHRDGVWDDDD